MPGTLPPILPSNNLKTPSGVGGPARAQDFSVSKLQYQKDRASASVSASQVDRSRQGRSGPATSISSIGGKQNAVTSTARNQGAKRSIYDNEYVDETRERLRHKYVRGLIKERKVEEEAAKAPKPSKFKFSMGTGKSFKRGIRGGLDKKLRKSIFKHRASFKHLSKDDRKVFGDIIQSSAAGRSTGVGYAHGDRRRMKLKVEQQRKTGKISYTDSKTFKKMIDQLE